MTQLICLGFGGINKRKRRPVVIRRPVPGHVALVLPGAPAPVQPQQQQQPVVPQQVRAIHNQQVTLFNRQTTLHRSQFQLHGDLRDVSNTQQLICDGQRQLLEQQEANADVEYARHEQYKAEFKKLNEIDALRRKAHYQKRNCQGAIFFATTWWNVTEQACVEVELSVCVSAQ
ncbi:hypothetical protein FN846DRAFT_914647 [Sphaerosporella brunnea]|uniref:Uncharacterized protein n=1 Tax=Sphaerosporella brunnea TaxID=1250544 RepID=A0A5J5ECG7_9PEZI|nr:hypothetical protein FN846DRAFT_914647 [Sphaerosporella brunnea]